MLFILRQLVFRILFNNFSKRNPVPKLIIEDNIEINAPAAKVWDVLTNPAQTKKYMFGCETVSDWKVGNSLLWRGEYEGKSMVFVKGTLVKLEPNKALHYTVIDPNGTYLDTPENELTVSYELSPGKTGTLLTVTQGDYSTVAEGEKRYNETLGGWNAILVKVKEIAEGE